MLLNTAVTDCQSQSLTICYGDGITIQGHWTSLTLDFLVAQILKNLPVMQKNSVQSLGWEELLEKGMATCSSILAWKILWTEEPGGLQSRGSQRLGHD